MVSSVSKDNALLAFKLEASSSSKTSYSGSSCKVS